MKVIYENETDTAYETIEKAGVTVIGEFKLKNQQLKVGDKVASMPTCMTFYHNIYQNFDILIVPFGQKLFKASFTGRLNGAIGITYKINTLIFGKDEEDANHNLYLKYEHISNLKLKEQKHHENTNN